MTQLTSQSRATSKSNRQRIERRKDYGAFYTPAEIISQLCDWAIRSPNDRILEPSFGGCGFLEGAYARLKSIGNSRPSHSIFGCDIDEEAFEHLHHLPTGRIGGRFVKDDFMSLTPRTFGRELFDVVIGNPPYVSHHALTPLQKQSAANALRANTRQISGRSSLWAYFVAHSLSFLREGGRLGMLLPTGLLQADYAHDIREMILRGFNRVLTITLKQRLFQEYGTDEATVVLLAEGWHNGPAQSGIEHSFAASTDLLATKLAQGRKSAPGSARLVRSACQTGMSAKGLACYSEFTSLLQASRLGDVASVSIGIVTGRNRFFVISDAKAKEWGLPEDVLTPILPKAGIISGVRVTHAQLRSARSRGKNTLLVDTRGKTLDYNTEQYLDSLPSEERDTILTFQKRDPWHAANDGRTPHAFLTYMSHDSPRIVLNEAETTCTNSFHRIFFNERTSTRQRRLVAISFLTTFTQLSAEICGRLYGSGLLKHEPKDARSIHLLIPDSVGRRKVDQTFIFVNKQLNRGDITGARKTADEFIFAFLPKTRLRVAIAMLERELVRARQRRHVR